MDIQKYLSLRKSYNIACKTLSTFEATTFEEFSILCHLNKCGDPQCVSSIATWQKALRPTLTHRTGHLESLGYISRLHGLLDGRSVACKITELGLTYIKTIASEMQHVLSTGVVLSRIDADRVLRYVDAIGSIAFKTSDLILLDLSIHASEDISITDLVEHLVLIQPTVSMAVKSLEQEGLITRSKLVGDSARQHVMKLTAQGRALVQKFSYELNQITAPRSKKATLN